MASKPAITKSRYTVVREFDYLTAGRTYDFETRSKSRYVDVRRIDGSGIGTFLQMWQFKRALADGSLMEEIQP
jgi:hypothetical protein